MQAAKNSPHPQPPTLNVEAWTRQRTTPVPWSLHHRGCKEDPETALHVWRSCEPSTLQHHWTTSGIGCNAYLLSCVRSKSPRSQIGFHKGHMRPNTTPRNAFSSWSTWPKPCHTWGMPYLPPLTWLHLCMKSSNVQLQTRPACESVLTNTAHNPCPFQLLWPSLTDCLGAFASTPLLWL